MRMAATTNATKHFDKGVFPYAARKSLSVRQRRVPVPSSKIFRVLLQSVRVFVSPLTGSNRTSKRIASFLNCPDVIAAKR